jgi:hypothetical protein
MRRLLALVLLLSACNQEFDPADRRAADRDEYDIRDETCGVEGGRAVARGTLRSYAEVPEGFSVTVRFWDGAVDLGRPQIVDHVELLASGETWDWEASVDAGDATDVRCNVIAVAIGQDVDH